MYKRILTVAIGFIFLHTTFAQAPASKDDLLKQRQQLQQEIEETERALNETKTNTKVNLKDLSKINKRIDLQDNLIENISGQIKFIESDINNSQKEVSRLSKALDTLKQEYAKSMVYAYKTRNNYDFLNFIFSASNFNDAVKRITYLKSYRTYREMQGENIVHTQDLLKQRINELSGNRQKKNIALQEKSKEMTDLEKKQQEKLTIVKKLKGRQKELAVQISNKRKQDAKLKNLIAVMIKREIDIARKKAAAESKANTNTDVNTAKTNPAISKTSKNTGSVLVSSEADRVLNADFERNKGSLPWPANGEVLIHYGSYTIPGTTPPIRGENPGVNIGTDVGAPVKAVFDGEVTVVSFMEDKEVVCIKHGKYYTVYSNLGSANVQRGDNVKTGQVIGKAGANDEGQGQVDFILMKESNNVNPEQWLRH